MNPGIVKLMALVIGLLLSFASPIAQTNTATVPPKASNPNLIIIKEAGIQYEIPAGWRSQQHENALQITSPDGGISVIIGLAVNDNTEGMIAGLKEYMQKDYTNFKVAGELQKEELNGLRALIENGTGETSEGIMEWNIAVLIGSTRPVIAFTVAEQKAFKNSQSDYIKFVQSIRKAG